jgi:preprotein translocase subunit SecG
MSILYILLTILMFVDCVFLVFLVLLQLPKKEAGAGMAFGGAATDALFGAGSGNVLTKITKYVAGIFFGLAILMAWMAAHKPKSDAASLIEKVVQHGSAPIAQPPPPESAPASTPSSGGLLQLSNIAPMPAASSNAGSAAAPAPPPPTAPKVNTNK